MDFKRSIGFLIKILGLVIFLGVAFCNSVSAETYTNATSTPSCQYKGEMYYSSTYNPHTYFYATVLPLGSGNPKLLNSISLYFKTDDPVGGNLILHGYNDIADWANPPSPYTQQDFSATSTNPTNTSGEWKTFSGINYLATGNVWLVVYTDSVLTTVTNKVYICGSETWNTPDLNISRSWMNDLGSQWNYPANNNVRRHWVSYTYDETYDPYIQSLFTYPTASSTVPSIMQFQGTCGSNATLSFGNCNNYPYYYLCSDHSTETVGCAAGTWTSAVHTLIDTNYYATLGNVYGTSSIDFNVAIASSTFPGNPFEEVEGGTGSYWDFFNTWSSNLLTGRPFSYIPQIGTALFSAMDNASSTAWIPSVSVSHKYLGDTATTTYTIPTIDTAFITANTPTDSFTTMRNLSTIVIYFGFAVALWFLRNKLI